MKSYLYIICTIVCINVSCSQRKIIISEDQLPDDIFYLKDEIKPYTGKCFVYFINTTTVKEELTFKDGLLNGPRISYYKDGKIKRSGNYSNGNLDGKWKGFDEKGNMIFEVQYKNDSLIGKYFSWYPTGVIKEKGLYDNNHKTGEWIIYDEAGMIVEKCSL